MPNHYHELLFTDAVKDLQIKAGSRNMYERHEVRPDTFHATLSESEIDFIEAQDSFYMASISASGWPYVQHRGGYRGFFKHVDQNMLAFADYTGNKQYISTGNFQTDNRVSIILMDYTIRRRIKLLGYASIDEHSKPELLEKFVNPDYPAPIERVVKINVEAFEWNCPKYITERYSLADVHQATDALRTRIAKLEQALTVNGIEIPN